MKDASSSVLTMEDMMVQNLDKNNTDKKLSSKQTTEKNSTKESTHDTTHSTKTGKNVIRRTDPSGLPKLR